MSFLDKVSGNKPVGVNPFGNKPSGSSSTTSNNLKNMIPGAVLPAGMPGKPTGMPTGVPKAPTGVPTGVPKAPVGVPKGIPTGASKIASIEVPTAIKNEHKTKKASAEEIIKEIKLEESKTKSNIEPNNEIKKEVENVEVKVTQNNFLDVIKSNQEEAKKKKEEIKEAKKEEKKEVAKTNKTKATKTKNNRTVKAKTTGIKEIVDTPNETITESEVDIINKLFKMPNTTVQFDEAIQSLRNNFNDEVWEKFKNESIEESDGIEIEPDMQEGAIKKTIARLSSLREKIWVTYIDTKALFENLSNKDTEGMIERIKFANYEGSNETARKKNGVLAVMNYETPEGEKLNLYQLYDETKNRFYFLKGLMDTVQYKTNVLITMLGAVKLEKNHSNNQ